MNFPHHPFRVVEMFEENLAAYCGAPYAVAVESCTSAIFLCLKFLRREASFHVCVPRRTYIGVAMAVLHAGHKIKWVDYWNGKDEYELHPTDIIDSARWLSADMYKKRMKGALACLSFHWRKHLPIGRGGAILTDKVGFVEWAKRARLDGRPERLPPDEWSISEPGWHMYMTPEQAASGLVRLASLPEQNEDLPCDDYPDLSEMEVFK